MSHSVILRASEGPFRCDHCKHWNESRDSCNESKIIVKAQNGEYGLSINKSGEATPLRDGDCCDYFKKGQHG